MKHLIASILAAVSLSFSAVGNGTYSQALYGNAGDVVFLFGATNGGEPQKNSIIYLDTSEVDTSKYFYDLLGKPINGILDTIGYLHFDVKDSTGTDSAAAKVVWWGNSRSDGLGTWNKIDSVTKGPTASASSYASATPAAVVNTKGYAAIRFTLVNPLTFAVAQKCAVKNVVLVKRQRLGSIKDK